MLEFLPSLREISTLDLHEALLLTLHALTDNLHNAYQRLPSQETITWMNSSSPRSIYGDSIIIVHKYHQQSRAMSSPCSSA